MVKNFFKDKEDPITGDILTFSEQVSWIAQGFIRRWSWIIFNVVFSVIYWIYFGIVKDPAILWNSTYSLLAIVIESVVGLAMFSQTRRDAVKLRKLVLLEEQIAKSEENLTTLLTEIKLLCSHSSVVEQ